MAELRETTTTPDVTPGDYDSLSYEAQELVLWVENDEPLNARHEELVNRLQAQMAKTPEITNPGVWRKRFEAIYREARLAYGREVGKLDNPAQAVRDAGAWAYATEVAIIQREDARRSLQD